MADLFGGLPDAKRPGRGNVSTAVRQRRVEAIDSLDDFPTPPWATRAVIERLGISGGTGRDPCANRGHMVRPMREAFDAVEGFDIHDYGAGFPVRDYLSGSLPKPVDWTFQNPPFRLAEAFIDRALATSRVGVAVLVRSAFLEGVGRHERLYSIRPPSVVYQFVERVVMHKGRLAPEGSSATAYSWLVWRLDVTLGPCRLDWIPPCRRRLERRGDYPEAVASALT